MNIIEDENTADHIISQIAACTYAESYQTKNWKKIKEQLKKELILEDRYVVLIIINKLKRNEDLGQLIKILEFCSVDLKNDNEIVLNALEQHGWNLEYLNEKQKDNKDIVSMATFKNGRPIKFASTRLKADRDFILKIAKKSGCVLEHVSDKLKDDKELVLIECQHYGNLISHASYRLKNDKEVALVAVTKTANAINCMSKELRKEIDNHEPVVYLTKAIMYENLQNKLFYSISKKTLNNTKTIQKKMKI